MREPIRDSESASGPKCMKTMKDPRERHSVCKLDRYDLEDRYLRLLEEVGALKKLSNGQEDKIKRLATKLMRFTANPRGCLAVAAADPTNDRERLLHLEAENTKLRNKMCVLRNQLVNNKIFARSPPRSRRAGSASGLITCRSEGSRLKPPFCQCINARFGNDENDVQNYSLRIQEMESEKKEMMSRIADLEAEIVSFTSGNKREKVAENVGYIRVWRQLQLQNEKLLDTQSVNEMLNKQIFELKARIKECNKSNLEISAALEAEKIQVAQLDESTSRAQDSEIDLHERDERISGLSEEIKILQEHNLELVNLSSKFDSVEQENSDLKRQIAKQMSEHQSLRHSMDKDKVNMVALQAANEQLLTKVHELQKNVDLMSIQLMAQNEKYNTSPKNTTNKKGSSPKKQQSHNKEISNTKLETRVKKTHDPEKIKSIQYEKGIQTGEEYRLINETTQTDNFLDSAKMKGSASPEYIEKYDKSKIPFPRNGNSLSREGMLKLLEEVQINAPLESQNSVKIRHTNSTSLPAEEKASKLETMLFGNSDF